MRRSQKWLQEKKRYLLLSFSVKTKDIGWCMHSDYMTRVRSCMCRELWAFLVSITGETFLRASERWSVFFLWWPADTSKSSCPLSWLVNSRWTLMLPSALMNPPVSCASSSILVAQSLFRTLCTLKTATSRPGVCLNVAASCGIMTAAGLPSP